MTSPERIPSSVAVAAVRRVAPHLREELREAVAATAVELLAGRVVGEARLMSAEELAADLGRSRAWVYRNKDLLGVRYRGTGPKPRLDFELDVALQRLAAASAARAATRGWSRTLRAVAHQPRQFDVVLERAEEGGFVVSVPDLPGVWTQGETRDEALANVREAIAGYLETLDAEGWPIPEPVIERATVTA